MSCGRKRAGWTLRLTGGVLAALSPLVGADARADEICRFTGTSDYNGRASVVERAQSGPDGLAVDVQARFDAEGWLWRVRFLVEEESLWRDGTLVRVAVNGRYLSGDHVVRQQWDRFDASAGRLEAERVQGKRQGEFATRYPEFAAHWDPSSFGAPWLGDYQAAGAERRPDLDLAPPSDGATLRTPLAMAFYWVRFLPPSVSATDVFLPGFKGQRLVSLPVTAEPWGAGTAYRTVLRHQGLSTRTASTATEWVGPDRHVVQMAFSLHSPKGSADGVVVAQGCEGAP